MATSSLIRIHTEPLRFPRQGRLGQIADLFGSALSWNPAHLGVLRPFRLLPSAHRENRENSKEEGRRPPLLRPSSAPERRSFLCELPSRGVIPSWYFARPLPLGRTILHPWLWSFCSLFSRVDVLVWEKTLGVSRCLRRRAEGESDSSCLVTSEVVCAKFFGGFVWLLCSTCSLITRCFRGIFRLNCCMDHC